MIKYLPVFILLIILNHQICNAQVTPSSNNQSEWSPWEYSTVKHTTIKEVSSTTSITNPFLISLSLWKEISTQDGPTCPFRPSCSGYMITAIRTYGPLCGWCMGIDRFMRDHKWANDDNYPIVNGFLYDPVEKK
jgi:putative component of membrane protein insertase Oxa1/YidC/SpoIIIJ protein YidD